MTEKNQSAKAESLGGYLRRLRIEKNFEIEDVLQETKIPQKTIRAMEADDYDILPADVFARGFYTLYAKFLGIDHNEVISRYEKERKTPTAMGSYSLPSHQGKQVNTLAARPSMATGSFFGFGLVVLIAFIALVCWYYSWNPATFLSEKLRSFQGVNVEAPGQNGSNSSGIDSAADVKDGSAVESKHFLTIDFLEDTTITISIDNSTPDKSIFTKGSTRSWYANDSLAVILPESAKVKLFFNGYQIDLPAPRNGSIAVNLP